MYRIVCRVDLDCWYEHGHILYIETFPFRDRQFAGHPFRCTDRCKFWWRIPDRDIRRRSGHAFRPSGASFGGGGFVDG